MTPNEYFDSTSSLIKKKVTTFNDGIDSFENGIYRKILSAINQLELNTDDTIKVNRNNLRALRTLKNDLEKIIINDSYIAKLDTFLNGFDQLKGLSDRYLQTIASGAIANKQVYNAVLAESIDLTRNSLLSSGISKNLVNPINKILVENITTGGNFNELKNILQTEILGDSERLGSLQRYTTQITRDSLGQFNANYNQILAGDLGLQYYLYRGGIKTTTRSYCKARANKYFHIKEIQNEIPQDWSGKIPTTNKNNILINRGGYNCNHQYIPVSDLVVPESVKERARQKGYV